MSREVQVRFYEGRAVRSRPATLRVVLCRSAAQAQAALAEVEEILGSLGLELHSDKTKVVDLREGRVGLDFLGCHFGARMSGRQWEQRKSDPVLPAPVAQSASDETAPREGFGTAPAATAPDGTSAV